MDDVTEDLVAAKQALAAQRVVSRREANALERTLNAPYEADLDAAMRAAYEAGATRSALARATGESRVTVNERLQRAYGDATPKRKIDKPDKPPKIPEMKPYLIDDEGYLLVDYHQYGPDRLTGAARLEIIADDDGVTNWFLAGPDAEDWNPQILEALDTRFEGWYYEDALAFVKTDLDAEENNEEA